MYEIKVGDLVYVEKMNYWRGEVLKKDGPLYYIRADSPDAEILFVWATRAALCCVKPIEKAWKEQEEEIKHAEGKYTLLRLTLLPPYRGD